MAGSFEVDTKFAGTLPFDVKLSTCTYYPSNETSILHWLVLVKYKDALCDMENSVVLKTDGTQTSHSGNWKVGYQDL